MHAPRPVSLKEQLLKSRFFLIAFFLHLIIFFMISTVVIFQALAPKEDFESGQIAGDAAGAPNPPPPPPQPQEVQQMPAETVPVSTQVATSIEMPSIDRVVDDMPTAPVPQIVVANADAKLSSTPIVNQGPVQNSAITSFNARAAAIKGMVNAWTPPGATNGSGPQGTGRDLSAVFTCYVGKYNAPDWSANLEMRDGKIFRGAMPNLLRTTEEWSNGRIKANVQPEPLNIASPEIFEKKPPFIYFTGHTNFVLTDAEVDNLRKYVMAGGAIWGDNALAGKGSRFDLAFRREMKRVIPDIDKQFEVVPLNHPIFTKGFFPMTELPTGINFTNEPLECIKIDGDIAVVYSLNNYGFLMRMAFKKGVYDRPDMKDGPDKIGVTPWGLWINRTTYYRNFEPSACLEAQHLGLNIICHLLTRFHDKLLLVP